MLYIHPWMLTIIQQVGYCYFVFCRYASFTGNFHVFLVYKLRISPPTSAFVIIFHLNIVLLLIWALYRHRRSWLLTGMGRQFWRDNISNLLKWTMSEGKDSLKLMIPFEWISSKHISLSHQREKKSLRIFADKFFSFHFREI